MSALYVCENCGRLAPIESFNDDCRPGWTHGLLINVAAMEDDLPTLTANVSAIVHEALIDRWERAEAESDEVAEEACKRALTALGLPWVRQRAATSGIEDEAGPGSEEGAR